MACIYACSSDDGECVRSAGSDIGVQIRNLRNGVDVVVGTPGRVIDLIERKLLRLDEVSHDSAQGHSYDVS